MSFLSELKRRNVLRTALGYLAASWLLIQIAETLFPVFDLSNAAVRLIVIVLGIGFIPVLALSWAMEWTPEGLKKDSGHASGLSLATKHAKTWDRIILLVLALALGLTSKKVLSFFLACTHWMMSVLCIIFTLKHPPSIKEYPHFTNLVIFNFEKKGPFIVQTINGVKFARYRD